MDDVPALSHTLELWHFTPVKASGGPDALELLADPQGPELAVLDWERMAIEPASLREASRQRRDSDQGLYMILLTDRRGWDGTALAQAVESDACLVKPFQSLELRARLNVGTRIIRVRHGAGADAGLGASMREVQDAEEWGTGTSHRSGVDPSDRQVLIVDDEESVRSAFRRALERTGCAVRTAACAPEALRLMDDAPAQVIFLDLRLPGMGGLELCRKIRERWPMAILYAVTGYDTRFELPECRMEGFEDYFTKPVSIHDLQGAAGHAFEKLARWQG